MEWIRELIRNMQEAVAGIDIDLQSFASMLIRFILPALAIIVVVRCIKSLMQEKSEIEIWGQLKLANGTLVDLNNWENAIGRANASDVYIDYPTISRNHAALNRDDKGNWMIFDVQSSTGVEVAGKKIEPNVGVQVKSGDKIELGGVPLTFVAADNTDEYEQAASRTRPGRLYKQHSTLIFLTQFQALLGLQLYIASDESVAMAILFSFLALIGLMWGCYIAMRALKRVAFEIETLAFFLSTLGLTVVVSSAPARIATQTVFLVLGLILFFTMGWILRDINIAKLLKRPIVLAGPIILAATLVLGERIHGATRWISIAGLQFQPSEFVKIAVIFAGAATLERMYTRRNLFGFLGFMIVCMGILAPMRDFGTALIFFVAFLVIAFLRSGDFATIFLSIAGAGMAGLVAISLMPHIAGRFASWGRAWEYVNTAGGYQQTRAMSAAASGGLFGVGAGNGWFNNIFAADSDLVFAMLSEELGLIIALCAVFAVVCFAIFSIRAAASARSSFYVIGACAASSMLVFQMLLNVLGSMDIAPFTGVTFPFVSTGGTSIVASWGMLAFFKAVDTRQNASFAVKTPKRPKYSGGGAIVYRHDVELPIFEGDEI
ncbi:MAG: FtsW/RodA/SpoVE family cell cycle protein [Oscillospiraceae bacterium]|nr:FtsW/RodA/SpoVE family cell cycle protein [Oscillospiraceae bacterium]